MMRLQLIHDSVEFSLKGIIVDSLIVVCRNIYTLINYMQISLLHKLNSITVLCIESHNNLINLRG